MLDNLNFFLFLNVSNETGEENLLNDVTLEGAEGRQSQQQLAKPVLAISCCRTVVGGVGAQLGHRGVADEVQVLGT